MAFTKLINVKDEFRKLFSYVTIMYKGAAIPVLVRYAVKSAFDYTEEQGDGQQIYPVISIYDRGIRQSDKWNQTGFTYMANQTDVGGDNPIGTIYYEPLLLTFSFDVGIAAKSMLQHTELEEYMFKNIINDADKLFNKVSVANEEIGEPILLRAVPQKIPREDGVHESNYDVSFDAWMNLKDPQDVELIKQLNISIQPAPLL